jgi:hypothetical protein
MFKTHSRSGQDFSVGAYKHLDSERARYATNLANAFRALGRGSANIIGRLLIALYETRLQEALAVLERYGHLIEGPQPNARTAHRYVSEARTSSYRFDSLVSQAGEGTTIRCSITGAPCEGDRAHLCDEWGCARKGGRSPISHENF